jgi:hypothetical protein
MPRLINPDLFRPRNFIVIGLIALAIHIVASPLYKMVDGGADNSAS